MGFLFDVITEVETDYEYEYSPYITKKEAYTYSPQTTQTTTYSPTSVYDVTYAPQYVIHSPSANVESKKEGASALPSVITTPTQTVSPSQEDLYAKKDYKYEEDAPLTGGGSLDMIVGLGVVGVIGVIAISYFTKKKKGKTEVNLNKIGV